MAIFPKCFHIVSFLTPPGTKCYTFSLSFNYFLHCCIQLPCPFSDNAKFHFFFFFFAMLQQFFLNTFISFCSHSDYYWLADYLSKSLPISSYLCGLKLKVPPYYFPVLLTWPYPDWRPNEISHSFQLFTYPRSQILFIRCLEPTMNHYLLSFLRYLLCNESSSL